MQSPPRVPAFLLAMVVLSASMASAEIPRTASGHPDLSGNYDIAMLTPLQRPASFGDNLFLTPEEAAEIEERERQRSANPANEGGGADRGAPPVGGDGSEGAEGNVGGYNSYWTDRGSEVFAIDGKFRTSMIFDPPNGRIPPMTPEAIVRAGSRRRSDGKNDGTAWWLANEGPGPFDDMELRPRAERCLMGFGSTAGPPMLPVLYNNLKTIIQAEDHIVILVEMVHDARVVRIGAEHAPAAVRRPLGDSIGWWEGDTLVVDTTNFDDHPSMFGATSTLHVVEKFTPIDGGDLLYNFTVEDPNVWTSSWSGEYRWPSTDTLMYEYACHEGNYALGNIMRGARLLEADATTGGL